MPPADDVILATVLDFAERSGAARVAVVLDRGPGHPAPLIEAARGEDVTIAHGDESVLVPSVQLLGVEPLTVDLPAPVPATALDADPADGRLEAPIGWGDALVRGVLELAAALGGRTVVHAEFTTRSGAELSFSGRAGEPVVVSIDGEQFESRSG